MASCSKSIVVFETALTGHRRHYVQVIDRMCAEQGWKAVFCLPPVNGKLRLESEIDEIIVDHPISGIRNGLYRLKFFVNALLKHRPTDVIIPTADGLSFYLWLLYPLFLSLNIRLFCVQHRLQFGYAKSRKHILIQAYTNFAILAAGNCEFHSVDEVPVEYLKKHNPLRVEVGFIPDPLPLVEYPEKATAREESSLPQDETIVGCVGVMDARKCVPEILNLLETLPAKAKILLAGEFNADLKPLAESFLQRYPDRLIIHDRFLGEKEMFSYLSSLDGVILLQRGHVGISSFGLHAIRMGVPMMAADTPWFRLMQERYPDLVTVNTDSAKSAEEMTSWVNDLSKNRTNRIPRSIPESEPAFRRELLSALTRVF